MRICLHCFVSGLVQGVYFRGAARHKANELGVTGWARNLPDGRVEVVACGEGQAVIAFQDWLWQGPPAARVTDVVCVPMEPQEFTGFSVA